MDIISLGSGPFLEKSQALRAGFSAATFPRWPIEGRTVILLVLRSNGIRIFVVEASERSYAQSKSDSNGFARFASGGRNRRGSEAEKEFRHDRRRRGISVGERANGRGDSKAKQKSAADFGSAPSSSELDGGCNGSGSS